MAFIQPRTESELCDLYERWCAVNILPHWAAEELWHEDYITAEQSEWLLRFMEEWDAMLEADYPVKQDA